MYYDGMCSSDSSRVHTNSPTHTSTVRQVYVGSASHVSSAGARLQYSSLFDPAGGPLLLSEVAGARRGGAASAAVPRGVFVTQLPRPAPRRRTLEHAVMGRGRRVARPGPLPDNSAAQPVPASRPPLRPHRPHTAPLCPPPPLSARRHRSLPPVSEEIFPRFACKNRHGTAKTSPLAPDRV